MAAYVIVQVKVKNQANYEEYKKLTPQSLVKYQGKFIVRGGKSETLEGDWNPERIVVAEFPTAELAKSWWSSVEYAPAKIIRQQNAETQMILIDGV